MENKLCFWISLILEDKILKITSKNEVINKIKNNKFKGMIFPYACLGEQDTGIQILSKKFRINKNSLIKKIPLRYSYKDGICILPTTDIFISNALKNTVKNKGITAYWDEKNLILLSTEEFNFILKLLRYKLHLNQYRLGLYYNNLGPDLVLVTI